MEIKFNYADITLDTAAALAAILYVKFGPEVIKGLDAGNEVKGPVTFGDNVTNIVNHSDDAPATEGPVGGEEVDARGYAWDVRIHSGAKTRNADGTWKKFRGVSDDLVKQVEDEQDAKRGATTTNAAPPPPSETKAPPPPSETLINAVAASAIATNPFVEGMKKVTALQKKGLLTDELKAGFLAAAGLESLAKGSSNPEGMQVFVAMLDAEFPDEA